MTFAGSPNWQTAFAAQQLLYHDECMTEWSAFGVGFSGIKMQSG